MSYKKWVYKYKYLKTEESEFAEKMQEYTLKFNEDFVTNTPPQEIDPTTSSQKPPLIEEEEKVLELGLGENMVKKYKQQYSL